MIFKSIFKEGNHKVFDTLIKFEYVFLKLVFMVIKILKPGGVGGVGDGRCWGVEGYLSIILWIELDVWLISAFMHFSQMFFLRFYSYVCILRMPHLYLGLTFLASESDLIYFCLQKMILNLVIACLLKKQLMQLGA